jgi:hypothetical protein
MVSSFAGGGSYGYQEGVGNAAIFGSLGKVVADHAGNIFVADFTNIMIRKITSAGETKRFIPGGSGDTDGVVPFARFRGPAGLAIDIKGNFYFADYYNNKIKKVSYE